MMRYPFVGICPKDNVEVNPDLFPNELRDIVTLFEEDNGGALNLIKLEMGRLFLEGDANELMLRLTVPLYFVVARVQFSHVRQGYMSRLVTLLTKLVHEHPEKSGIKVECVVSPEMLSFCEKHHFRRIPQTYDFVHDVSDSK